MNTIKLYRFALSGHSHRVQLMLSLLGLEAELININLAAGEHKTAAFLAKNPAGQVPVIEDGEVTLADSNAILVYLSSVYDAARTWYPTDVLLQSRIQGFLSLAAGKLAFGAAAARVINVFGAQADKAKAQELAHGLLRFLESQLAAAPWLVSEHPTIADVAMYTYIAHAPEGDVALDDYPNVRAWLSRIEQLPGFVAMQKTPVGLLAKHA